MLYQQIYIMKYFSFLLSIERNKEEIEKKKNLS